MTCRDQNTFFFQGKIYYSTQVYPEELSATLSVADGGWPTTLANERVWHCHGHAVYMVSLDRTLDITSVHAHLH